MLKKADEFPDYLKVEATLKGLGDLTEYLENLQISTLLMESEFQISECAFIRNKYRDTLLEYIRQ